MNDLSRRLIEWKARNGWSYNQIVTGISMATGVSIGWNTIRDLAEHARGSAETAKRVRKFMNDFPRPVSFDAWRERFLNRTVSKELTSEEVIARRREALEREREERRRRLLANERRPWRRADNHDEFRLDGATIRALSGGTMRGLGHG